MPLGEIVRVTAQIAPVGALRRESGRTLYLHEVQPTTDPETAASNIAVRAYAGASAVASDYPSGEVNDAAEIYFQQSPFPRNFVVGGWLRQGQPAVLIGAELTPTQIGQAALRALGTITLTMGTHTTGNIDLSSVADLAGAVGLIQAGLDTQVSGATAVVLGTNRILVTFPAATAGLDLDAGFTSTPPAAAGSLGLSGAGLETIEPVAAEGVADALTRIESSGQEFSFVTVGDTIRDTTAVQDVASWVSARRHIALLDSSEASVITPNETTSQLAILAPLRQNRVGAVWSETPDHKAVSVAARFSSINFDAPNSIITGKFKSLPGTTPDDLGDDGIAKGELDRKRVNVYRNLGFDAILEEGQTFGTWIDVQYWLDLFVDALEVAVYNLLRQSPTRVPQTDRGAAAIQDVVEGVCEQGVRNGGLAPGQLSPALTLDAGLATGVPDFDGFLSTGYLVHIGSFAEQDIAVRNERRAPPVRVWAKGSGAVHFADVDIVFEN